MEQTCSNCGTTSPATARFCPACGVTLAATVVRGRTVVVSPQLASSPAQRNGGHRQNRGENNTLSPRPAPAVQTPVLPLPLSQRELTLFAQDISGSMDWSYDERYTKLQAAQRAVMSMVLEKARLDPHDEIGLVAFDDEAKKILDLCPIVSHKHQILEAIQSLRIEGGTDINEGLKLAREMFDWARPDVVRRIVLLTDGQGGHPLRTAEDLKTRGVVIDVRGVGDSPQNVDEKLLRKVASVVEGEVRYRFIKDSRTLVDDYTRLATKTAIGA